MSLTDNQKDGDTVDFSGSARDGGLHVRCPHCHNPIELVPDAELSSIPCPSCGSAFSLTSDETSTRDAATVTTIGQFQLIERLGMGAFGAVWKARDTQLDRTVAIKIPRKGQLSGEESEKFFREARSAAQLRHPHIVPVHEVGRQGDTLYIVSDFIRGVSLSEYIADTRLSQRETSELLVKVARALHHAHEKGIIHRDLKPQNIMLDDAGEPQLMDFGLAKRESGEITMTVEGAILGTPAYMSPEQARGESHAADRTTDIYSLGVVMFQLLTGELPFRGTTQMLLHKVLREEPPSPRRMDNRIAKDLETICLKCLEKDPKRRYTTAAAVADELQRFLEGRPITARPIGRIARGWRWAQRNRAVAGLGLSLAAVLAVAATLGPVVAWRESRLRLERDRANATLRDQLSQSFADRAESVQQEGRTPEAIAYLAHAHSLANDGSPLKNSYCNLMSAYTHGADAIVPHDEGVRAVDISHDGRLVVTASFDGTSVIWDRLAGVPVGDVMKHTGAAVCVSFSPDEKVIATGTKNGSLALWHTSSTKPLGQVLQHPKAIRCLAFTPDGEHVLTGCDDGRIRAWTVSKSSVLEKEWQLSEEGISGLSVLPDGERIAAVTFAGDFSLFSWQDSNRDIEPISIGCKAFGMAGNASGETIVINGEEGQMFHYEVATRKLWPMVKGGWNYGLAFSRKGNLLLFGKVLGEVEGFDMDSGAQLFRRQVHQGQVLGVAISDDLRWLATGGSDATARVAELPADQHIVGRHNTKRFDGTSLAVSPDGRWLASGASNGSIQIWDLVQHMSSTQLTPHSDQVDFLRFARDSATLYSGARNELGTWHLEAGHFRGQIYQVPFEPFDISPYNSKSKLVIGRRSVGGEYHLCLWDFLRGKMITENTDSSAKVNEARFDATGRYVVGLQGSTKACVFHAQNLQATGILGRYDGSVYKLAMHPSSPVFFAAGSVQISRQINLEFGNGIGHELKVGVVCGAAYSNDGRYLLVAAEKGVRLFDANSGRLASVLDTEGAVAVVFSPNDAYAYVWMNDGQIRRFDIPQQLTYSDDAIQLWAQAKSAMRVTADGQTKQLSHAEWRAAIGELRSAKVAN